MIPDDEHWFFRELELPFKTGSWPMNHGYMGLSERRGSLPICPFDRDNHDLHVYTHIYIHVYLYIYMSNIYIYLWGLYVDISIAHTATHTAWDIASGVLDWLVVYIYMYNMHTYILWSIHFSGITLKQPGCPQYIYIYIFICITCIRTYFDQSI